MTDRKLTIAMRVLVGIGLCVATYLTYVHYAHIKVACSLGDQCAFVQASAYSKLAGVPVALIGLIGYITIGGLLLAPRTENTRTMLLTVVLIGWGFSMYLTYRELFTINAICEWCVSSATIMTLLAGLSITRFLRGGDPVAPAARADDSGTVAPDQGASPLVGHPTS
jgi:uncharacterized membrane protein